jgi:hypothetical protein
LEITSYKEHNMRGHPLLSSLIVTAALLAPGLGQAVTAAQVRAEVNVGPVAVRVYDRSHKDYHVWDDQEDQTYRQYLSDNHRTYRPIAKLSNRDQTRYWNSRHENEKR